MGNRYDDSQKRIGLGLSHMGFCFKLHNTLWDFYLLRQCRQTLSPKNESSRFYLPGFPLVTCGNGCDNQDCDAHNTIPLSSNLLTLMHLHMFSEIILDMSICNCACTPCNEMLLNLLTFLNIFRCMYCTRTAPHPRCHWLKTKNSDRAKNKVQSCSECKMNINMLQT